MRHEGLARIVVILLLAAAIGIPAVGWWQRSQGIVIHARMAETGGWTPENLTVAVGQPLHLRLTSDDVTHGFAIGQSDRPAVDVIPGEMADVTLVFDRPGKYTFYCTRWCSVNHWRMRGVIEVTGADPNPEPVKPPLYVTLGLDIDAAHDAEIIPGQIPSAWRGALLNMSIPAVYQGREYYLTHTPVELWSALRAEPTFQELTDQNIWDLVAWVWQSNTTPQKLQAGQQLYAANCAACHGEQGRGDGVFAYSARTPTPLPMREGDQAKLDSRVRVPPADFTDPNTMLAASPAHLQGKIIRGGMGTGTIIERRWKWIIPVIFMSGGNGLR